MARLKTENPAPPKRYDAIEEGQRLRRLRKEKKIPVTTLAKLCDASPNTIRALEQGKPVLRRTVRRVYEVLNDGPSLPLTDRPLLQEDINIAVLYHDAPTTLRNYIARLLNAREYATYSGPDPEVLAWADEVSEFTAEQQAGINALRLLYREYNQQKLNSKPPVKSARNRQTKADNTK